MLLIAVVVSIHMHRDRDKARERKKERGREWAKGGFLRVEKRTRWIYKHLTHDFMLKKWDVCHPNRLHPFYPWFGIFNGFSVGCLLLNGSILIHKLRFGNLFIYSYLFKIWFFLLWKRFTKSKSLFRSIKIYILCFQKDPNLF